jgi:hypothetical protein
VSKVGRNQLCTCGSKVKYKHCCLYRRHGGRHIKEKFYTSYDLRKEMIKRMIDANHVNEMNKIIEGKTKCQS